MNIPDSWSRNPSIQQCHLRIVDNRKVSVRRLLCQYATNLDKCREPPSTSGTSDWANPEAGPSEVNARLDRCHVDDLVTGREQCADLTMEDPGVFRIVNDRCDDDAHVEGSEPFDVWTAQPATRVKEANRPIKGAALEELPMGLQ